MLFTKLRGFFVSSDEVLVGGKPSYFEEMLNYVWPERAGTQIAVLSCSHLLFISAIARSFAK